MACGDQRIPDLLPWIALKYNEEHYNQVKHRDAPYTEMDADEHCHILFPGGIKESRVLKKDRNFNEDVDRIVKYFIDADPLV